MEPGGMEGDIPNTLRQLWQLAGADSQDPDPDWDTTFESIGLFLTAPPHHGGYFCTPVNSLEFASTGGDGVHYSLLAIEGAYSDVSPVIMTVPMSMCDTPNLVVGENLKEFLALGCRFGYFCLEQLVYDPDATLAELETRRFDPDIGETERLLLNKISSHFNIAPWADPRRRLQELASRYAPSILLPPRDGHSSEAHVFRRS
jgi:hypothetical protein